MKSSKTSHRPILGATIATLLAAYTIQTQAAVTYIGDAISHLERTMEGRQWVAQLYSNVFALEHHRQHMGPHLGESAAPSLPPSRPSAELRQREAPVNPDSPDRTRL